MKLIDSPKFYGLRNPSALTDYDENGYQRYLVSIDPNGIGWTEAEMLALAAEDSIALRFNQNEVANQFGRQSVSVKVL